MGNNNIKLSLSKKYRLKSQKKITEIFTSGHSDFSFPIKLQFLIEENQTSPELKAGFTVSKKKIKLAVNRNLVKRRMKEAYRNNKTNLQTVVEQQNISVNLMFVFVNNHPSNYQETASKIILLLHRLQHLMLQKTT